MKKKKGKFAADHFDKHAEFYEYWSGSAEGGHHFGMAEKMFDIFSNTKMVRNMSQRVLESLKLDCTQPIKVLDAGCGSGSIGRLLAQELKHEEAKIYGVGVSSRQLIIGEKINQENKLTEKIELLEENFESLPFPDNFFEAIFFVESICHGQGNNKEKALSEAFRVLKPGGRIRIQDGFLQSEKFKFGRLTGLINKKLCDSWGVEVWSERKLFLGKMEQLGFTNIRIENLSWKIGPSVLQALFIKTPQTFYYFLKKKLTWSDVKYVFTVGTLAPIVGLHPSFQYLAINAEKL